MACNFLNQMSEEVLRNYGDSLLRSHGGIFGREDAEATKRARELLVSKLEGPQRQEYEAKNYFHVIGGVTRNVYRIHEGRQMNIHEMHRDGRIKGVEGPLTKKYGWCFLPVGGLANGDVMLAQKLWLESDRELEALKIANKF